MRGFDPEKMKQVRANALANQPRLGFRPRGSDQERSQPGPGLGFGPTSKLEALKAQAQNQAPDSIPAMVKPGEFVLPPDTVHAMGGAGALQAAVDATHTPAAEEAWVPRGFKPKVFFANGGRPEDQIPLGGQRAAPAADGSQDNPMNSEFGRNVTNTLGALGGGAASMPGAIARVAEAGMGANALLGAGRTAGLAGRAASAAAPLGVPATGAAVLGAASEADRPTGGLPSLRAKNSAAPAVATTPSSSATTGAASSTMGPPGSAAPAEVMPGVYRRGNSYADSAQNAALGDQSRGLPSWRNMNAANNLAAQQQSESQARVQAAMAPPPTPAIQRVAIGGSGGALGFRRAPSLALADRVDAAQLRNAQRYNDRLSLQAGQQQLERERIAADSFRTARGFNVDQQRLDTERRLADSEITARGFKTRAQRQEEQLRNTFLDPNATPQQRQQAQQSLRALTGEAEPSPWKVTVTPAGKNADGSTTQGSIIRHNGVTGEVQQVDAGMAGGPKTITNDDAGRRALAALPSGSVYVGPDGKQYRKA